MKIVFVLFESFGEFSRLTFFLILFNQREKTIHFNTQCMNTFKKANVVLRNFEQAFFNNFYIGEDLAKYTEELEDFSYQMDIF